MRKFSLKVFSFFAPLFLLCVFSPPAALAAGSAPRPAWEGWLYQLINFAILVAVLYLALNRPLRGYLKARTEAVSKGLEEARRAREAAEAALGEIQDRLKQKDAQLEAIVRTARQSGEAEREALLEEAGRMGRKITEHADAYIAFELRKAKDAIRKEAVLVALELAGEKLRQKLTAQEQEKLIEDAVSQLEAGR